MVGKPVNLNLQKEKIIAMKKVLVILLVACIIITVIIGSCGEPEETTTSPATTSPTTTAATSSPATTTTPPTTGPVYGGTVRVINASGVNVMGYSLEQSPWDLFVLLCGVEKLIEYDENQVLVPHLAESFSFDESAQTINIKMREGIRFHDGSDCDAESIAWNYEQQVMNKRIGYLDQWDYLEIIDKYNFVIHYKGDYNNQLKVAWLWSPPMYSKAAFVDAGDGDIEKSKDWARLNVSGTGPFKQGEFIRDVSLTMVRNEDYWGGRPYLDAIVYYFIPDPVTASLKMQAGEAELWFGPSIKDQLELEEAGLTRLEGQPSVWNLYPNIIDPDSKWQNQDLREAVEYALDKEGMAEGLGFGYYKAAKMVVPEGKDGYDEDWPGRSYDVAKAKELLASSGYEGATVSVLVLTGPNVDLATSVKRYLDDIGLNCEIDIADPGRFYGSLYGEGWTDLIINSFGVMGSTLDSFQNNLGDQPLTKMGSWILPPDLLALSKESRSYPDVAGQVQAMDEMFMSLSEGAYLIPIYEVKSANMIWPYFHTTLGRESGFSQYWAGYWLETQ
jgi:peptide/nickel transport system substrate-binding protein